MSLADRRSLSVLHVIPSLAARTGGPATNLVLLASTIKDYGHNIVVFSTDAATSANAPDSRGGVTLSELPAGANQVDLRCFSLRHPYRFAFSSELGSALDAHIRDFDIVLIHGLYLYPQFAAWRAASRAHVPYVVTPHGALDPYLRRRGRLRKYLTDKVWQRRILDGAGAIHLTCEDERRLVLDLKIKAPHVVLPNGIDVSRFNRLPSSNIFRQRFLNGSNAPLIVNHGRIAAKKGLDILVDSMARVRKVHKTALLALVGPDDEGLSSRLREQAHRAGIGEAVIFCGMMQGTDLLAPLSAADLWVLPSHTEAFPMAVVEAMAAGLPVVTSPYVNLAPEAASEDALLIVDNTPDQVAAVIIQLLNDDERRRRLGCAGRQFVQRYDWMTVGRQMIDLYESILSGKTSNS